MQSFVSCRQLGLMRFTDATHCVIDCVFAKYQPCILSLWSFCIPLLSSIFILKIWSDFLWVLSTLLLLPLSTLSFLVLDFHTGKNKKNKKPAHLHGVQGYPVGMTEQLSAQVKACTLPVPLDQLWFWGRVVEDRKNCCSSIPEQRHEGGKSSSGSPAHRPLWMALINN